MGFTKYDSKAYALQSGRYMETIGWLSIDGIKGKGKKTDAKEVGTEASYTVQRRYIDNNLYGYHYHTGLNESTFPTEHGKNVSTFIHQARKSLKLDYNYGCAPKDLWLNRAPYPSNDSLLTWLENEVMPDIIFSKERKDVPTLAITNSGAMRFDIFKGSFSRDTTYIISPFVSKFNYIKDVPYKSAKDVYTSGGAQAPLLSSDAPDLIPGYTTKDDSGDDGDDTLHAPISFYQVPNCIQSPISFPSSGEPENVDVVVVDFIQPWVLLALQFSGEGYTSDDVLVYSEETLTDMMAAWIKKNWGQDC